MIYREVPLPEKHNGGLQFTHELHHEIRDMSLRDLKAKIKRTLAEIFPDEEIRWRFSVSHASYRDHVNHPGGLSFFWTSKMTVRFSNKRDALMFRMAWQD